jgi:hypothetical protein
MRLKRRESERAADNKDFLFLSVWADLLGRIDENFKI